MDITYLVTPALTWAVVGPIKFLISSVRQRRWAFNLVGNGGFPSNHSAVVTSMATLIALREGIGHPAFGVAVTLAFIVMIDANSLRQHVGPPTAVATPGCASGWGIRWSRSRAGSAPGSRWDSWSTRFSADNSWRIDE
jgi:acid phosphatase family membrane protein YuiD